MNSPTPGSVAELSLDLVMGIDRSGPVPLYFQLATRMQEAITDGRLPPGARLENEIVLSERLGLSRPTVRRAILELVGRGLLVRRRGIGTQVVQRPVTRNVELTSLYDDLEREGKKPTTELLQYELAEADAVVAENLSVAIGTPVLHLRRRRSADGVPIALLENFLAPEFSGLTEEAVSRRGLYQLLRARGVAIQIAHQRIGSRAATRSEGTSLGVRSGAPVLTMERTAYDNNGRAVEFGRHCYRPDLFSFQITLVSA